MDLNWESMESEEDFFAMVEKEDKDTNDILIPPGDDTPDDTEKDKDKTPPKVEEEEDLFNIEESENKTPPKEDGEEIKDKPSKKEKNTSITALTMLQEKGILDFDLEEGEELTEELANELLEDSYENAIEERITEKFSNLPADVKDMMQFVIKGGSLTDYINSVYTTDFELSENIDLDKEENQIAVMRSILSLEEDDEEEIEHQIEYLKDKGTLGSVAERKLNKYLAEQEKNKEQLLKAQNKKREEERLAIRENKKNLSSLLSETKDFNGLPVSRKAKTEIPSFMYDKTVELQNGGRITEMQKELYYVIPQNEVANAQLAILLKNRNEDGTFNFDAIAKLSTTQVVTDIKKNVRRVDNTPLNNSSSREKPKKALSDYFN